MTAPPTDDWWPRPQGRKPPRQPVDRARAVSAAHEMIERDGLEAFSMRKLAATLGVGAPALYWHLAGRDQLLSMVVEDALADFELPGTHGSWQSQLAELAHRWWHYWEARPQVGTILGIALGPIPTVLRNGEWVAGLLDQAGVPRRHLAGALASWNAFLAGTTRQVIDLARRKESDGAASNQPYVQAMLQLDPEAFPHLHRVAADYAEVESIEMLFEVGLRGLITGFASLAAP